MSKIALGFIPEPINVLLDQMLPSRRIPEGLTLSVKFQQIKSSIDDVGLIEPLIVGPAEPSTGKRPLIDGHIRAYAMQELGLLEAQCLVSTDVETYTYNNRINRLSTIQEHVMLRRAVERGVTPARLAKALMVDISHIQKKLNLLDGICVEAASLLKDQRFSANMGAVLRKMKPTRQIECVELMVSSNSLTVAYANCMLAATPAEMLVAELKPKKIAGVSAEQMARMEKEMGNLQGRFKSIEQSYGQDVLNLVLAKGYLTKLLANAEVMRFLAQRQPDVMREFTHIAEIDSLDK